MPTSFVSVRTTQGPSDWFPFPDRDGQVGPGWLWRMVERTMKIQFPRELVQTLALIRTTRSRNGSRSGLFPLKLPATSGIGAGIRLRGPLVAEPLGSTLGGG